MKKTLLILSLLLVVLLSCKKEKKLEPEQSNGSFSKNKIGNFTTFGITPYALDWENIDYMPTPPGMATVLVPWASGASRQFAPELANDYSSNSGWTLLYNTFNITTMHDNWYFILYNKYTGIIRMYYYIPNNANYITSSNLIYKLAIEGSYASSSPILNFADQQFVDIGTHSSFATTIQQWQVARSTWYILQYELAYDQNMSSQSYSTFNFLWPIRSSSITNVAINGDISGTLKGNINTQGNDFTISPSFTLNGDNNSSSVTINGSSDAVKLKPSLGLTLFNKIKDALLGGAQGIIKNILSGIFKRSSATPPVENTNLKINAKVTLTGTLTSDFLLTSPAFSIPGYNQVNTTGFQPLYNEPLGVFYLSAKPSVDISVAYIPTDTRSNRQYTCTVDDNSFNLIFNPAVLAIADIGNITKDILVDDTTLDFDGIISGGEADTPLGGLGVNTWGRNLYRITGNLVTYDNIIFYEHTYVRISFDVIPKDNSPTYRISKTFKAEAPNM